MKKVCYYIKQALPGQFCTILLLLLSSATICFAQADSAAAAKQAREQMQKVQQAQQKAMQQLKDMGIDIDPNKKMSAAELQALKQKLLIKAQQMQQQVKDMMPDAKTVEHKNIDISKIPTEKQVLQIADRFFKRSYKQLTIFQKNEFDKDFKEAAENKFSREAVRMLCNKGAELITLGTDHFFACVYLTAAVKAIPGDTLNVNNFGGYLRITDSLQASLPVLLYANELFSGSPVILTQIGCSLLELNDEVKAEKYLKEALKYNPGFGQAHTALCEVYIRTHRLKEAIIELFAGVKGMGASYNQASFASYQIQQQYDASGKDDFESKEEFWGETKKQMQPTDAAAPASWELSKIKMPAFPDCKTMEDWTFGGGWGNAVQAYKSFHEYMISSAEIFLEVHKQIPVLPENAVLRDYPNERLALDCITEMFMHYSAEESRKYHKSVDDIMQRLNDARDAYLKNHAVYVNEYVSCLKSCPGGDEICPKECNRKYCLQECPNANKFNEVMRQAYNNYRAAFNGLVSKQIKLLDDLYAFSNPWLAKIPSPYWSRLYAYEVRRVALGIVGNTYSHYPQPFGFPVKSDCGEDCSIFSVPFTAKPDEVNKQEPEGNNCPENSKIKIPLAICELGLDCESIEFGCTAGISGSVKKNFKNKNTTLFVGVGIKGELGVVGAGAKAGVVITVDGNGEVADVGGKVDLSVSVGVGAAKIGGSSSASLTVMNGFTSKAGFAGGFGKLK